ncbi:MAG TPA: hypothetical protein VF276_11780 [Chloroflexia bacterium]
MRIATPGPARSHLLLLATLVLVLGGGSVWLALGTARPLEAPPLPSANTALPSATPAPASARSPTATLTAAVAPTATATPPSQAGRAIPSRNFVAAGHNNRPANMVGYLQKHNQGSTETGFGHPTWLCLINTHPATAHGEAPHVHAI